MLESLKRQWELIREDWIRFPYKIFLKANCVSDNSSDIREQSELYQGGDMHIIINALCGFREQFSYIFWYRLSSLDGILGQIAKHKHRHLSKKYGVYIPYTTKIGGGLVIWHTVGIVINPKTIIGRNCDLFQNVTIGESKSGNAIIGDNVMIGAGSNIIGRITIGNHVKIGAGTVVVKDIPDNCTSVGNPNKNIKHE